MSDSTYTVELDNFSGPLDVLLQFIERQKLDICDVSLGTVTNDYLHFMQTAELDPHQANWFLVIATKLILVKSRALLPQEKLLEVNEEIEDLTEQLKQLAEYKRLAGALEVQAKDPLLLHSQKVLLTKVGDYENLSPESIHQAYAQLISSPAQIPKQTFKLKRQTNLELRKTLLDRLEKVRQLQLNNIHSFASNPQESVTLFMLILEMIKSRQALLSSSNGEYSIGINL